MEGGQRRFCLYCTLVTCTTSTVAANLAGQKMAKMNLLRPKIEMTLKVPVINQMTETPLGRRKNNS